MSLRPLKLSGRLSHLTFSCLATFIAFIGCHAPQMHAQSPFANYTLDYNSPVNPELQARLESIDTALRAKYGMTTNQTAVGILDLNSLRLAMIHPDRIGYAASVTKIGIFLAYFQLHPEAATNLNPEIRHELALMVRPSSNEMAAKFSREMGLQQIQAVLNS